MGLIAIMVVNAAVSHFIAARVRKRAIAFSRMQVVTLQAHPADLDSLWTPPPGIELTGRHLIHVSSPDFAERCREVRTQLQRAVAEGRCDQIVLTALWQDTRHIAALMRVLGPLPAPVVLLSDPALGGLNGHRRVAFGNEIGFELQAAPLGMAARWTKRLLDIVVAVLAIIILGPAMLTAATVILFETGSPILFRQDRRGFGGVPFKILKFRSMTVAENGADVQQAKRQDARVTAFGQILRRKSIDELPQLFNVLRGEMSIVGPRPHAMAHDDYYNQFIEHYAFRHHVKPGITGWAQVNGLRGATETPELMQARVEHDLWYVNHWSIWLDAKIILLTAWKVFDDDNAY
jgi:exopolysaccharide biosynthesis polyprenyl glycosylphosphotransferase